ncbi:hypothetical protein Tco_0632168, partial [Tanacetum coccineum]
TYGHTSYAQVQYSHQFHPQAAHFASSGHVPANGSSQVLPFPQQQPPLVAM